MFVPSMLLRQACSFTATRSAVVTVGRRRRISVAPTFGARLTKTCLFSTNSTAAVTSATSSPSERLESSSSTKSRLRVGRASHTRNTGGLRRLPVVKSPKELRDRAIRTIRIIKADKQVQNAKNRARKHGTESLNALMQALCVPLRDVVRGYQAEWKKLHPFERVVADLTARSREKKDGVTLEQVLDDIHEARKMLLELGKDWIAKVKNAESAREAGESLQEGIEAMLRCFDELAAPPVLSILEIQKSLRSAPIVRLDAPAVVLVGAPNVGKSSIVRCLSSATPEVNNYPFTTRGMTLGHVEVFWSSDNVVDITKAVIPHEKRKPNSISSEVEDGKYAFSQLCQIMDSPGLLVRPDHERNEMEALTLAAMQHLPTAVMYVIDLSGAAGDKCSSVEDQLNLRREVRSRFPRRPWIDVVSKVDLGMVDGVEDDLEAILDGAPYVKLSIHEGLGVEELKTHVLRMLGEVRLVLDALAAAERQALKT